MNNTSSSHDPEGGKIYVVDDDSMVRQSLFFSLRTAGYDVRSFSSGDDLLNEVDSLASGVILLDLRMPEKSGLEVLQEMGDRIRLFPVVIITGHGEINLAVQSMKLGAADFIEKPFGPKDLLVVLEPLFEALPMRAQEEMERNEAQERVAKLTERERDVLRGLMSGLSAKGAALRMGISPRTVEIHRGTLKRNLGVRSVGEAVRLAILADLKPG